MCYSNLFQDRPERAIYVPGAARRAQQQKGGSAAKGDDKPAEKKPKAVQEEITESPQESNESEGPSSEKTEPLEDKSPPTETIEPSEDVKEETVGREEVVVVEKNCSPDVHEEVEHEVDEPVPEASVKEDES